MQEEYSPVGFHANTRRTPFQSGYDVWQALPSKLTSGIFPLLFLKNFYMRCFLSYNVIDTLSR